MFDWLRKYFLGKQEEFKKQLEELERYEEDQRRIEEERNNRKRVVFKKLALDDDHAERLFNIAFYCHHSLDEDVKKQLDKEWKEYYEAGKESGEPILPYYYYVLERIDIKLKPGQL